jgi:alpha-tubulin suppressor-like RCC1 family protein
MMKKWLIILVGMLALNNAGAYTWKLANQKTPVQSIAATVQPNNVWGSGATPDGELGNGSNSIGIYSQTNSFFNNVSTCSAGGYHTVCIDGADNHFIQVTGYNGFGQLGNNIQVDTNKPISIQISQTLTISSCSAGGYHTVCVMSDGTVMSVGANASGQLGNNNTTETGIWQQVLTTGAVPLTNISTCSAGGLHTVCLDTSGNAYVFGNNKYGQLGMGNTTNLSLATKLSKTSFTGTGDNSATVITNIAAGSYHTIFTTANNSYSTGLNTYGQLGIGNTTTPTNPTTTPTKNSFTAGSSCSAGKIDTGGSGNAGDGDMTVGTFTVCWKGTTIQATGYNDFGQIGNGNTTSPIKTPVNTSLSPFNSAVSCSAGAFNFICTGKDSLGNSLLYGTGHEYEGELGNGLNGDYSVLTNSPITGYTMVGCSAGAYHTVCWSAPQTCTTQNAIGAPSPNPNNKMYICSNNYWRAVN